VLLRALDQRKEIEKMGTNKEVLLWESTAAPAGGIFGFIEEDVTKISPENLKDIFKRLRDDHDIYVYRNPEGEGHDFVSLFPKYNKYVEYGTGNAILEEGETEAEFATAYHARYCPDDAANIEETILSREFCVKKAPSPPSTETKVDVDTPPWEIEEDDAAAFAALCKVA
jgi:hypothetical protein